MNATPSARTFLAALLFIALGLSTKAATPAPAVATVVMKSGTSWETVPLGTKNLDDLFKAHPHPDYPSAARRVHATGRGIFKINFGSDGKVKTVEVLQSTGHISLDRECLGTFVHWQARHPDELKAVTVPINFSMQGW